MKSRAAMPLSRAWSSRTTSWAAARSWIVRSGLVTGMALRWLIDGDSSPWRCTTTRGSLGVAALGNGDLEEQLVGQAPEPCRGSMRGHRTRSGGQDCGEERLQLGDRGAGHPVNTPADPCPVAFGQASGQHLGSHPPSQRLVAGEQPVLADGQCRSRFCVHLHPSWGW